MKNFNLKLLSISTLLNILLLPNSAFAKGFINCSGATCSACNFVDLANELLGWLISMAFLFFAVLAVIAGFNLVTSGGKPDALTDAKQKFVNAFIGLIIILAAFLLVDNVMRALLTNPNDVYVGYGPWSEVKCGSQTQPTYIREGAHTYANAAEFAAESVGITPPSSPSAGSLTQAQAEALLPSGQFTLVSSGSCTDRTKLNCTSLDGIKPNTITRITELQSAVGVPFTITGGTEAGHANSTYSHGNGYKVDIRPTQALNDHIYNNFTKIGPTKYQDKNGNTYYRHEPDHWDVTITN